MAKRRGGMPGGMPSNMNMQNMMKQAQKMQQDMLAMQEELEKKIFEATVGGGAVKAEVTGKKLVSKITLDESAVDPDDVEMLEDLIVAAVNEALKKADDAANSQMSGLTGGLGNLGGLF